MGFNFNKMPAERPSGGSDFAKGRYPFEVSDTKLVSTKAGDPMLKVTLKCLDFNKRVWTNLVDNGKPFTQFIVSRFMTATDLLLEGDFELEDVAKLAKGRKLYADIEINDNGYPEVSFFSFFSFFGSGADSS